MSPPAAATAAAAAGLRASEADRAALAEVLARPEFRDRLADGLALRRLLLGWWDRLLSLLETPEAERFAGLGRLVFLLAVAAAVALLWRAGRRRAAARAARAAAPGGASAGAELVPGEPDPATGVAAAELALRAGDPARAVRAAFAAAAGALGAATAAARGTGGAALTGRELADRSGDAGFASLARLHERTVFGRRPVAPGEAARALEVARRLAAEVAR